MNGRTTGVDTRRAARLRTSPPRQRAGRPRAPQSRPAARGVSWAGGRADARARPAHLSRVQDLLDLAQRDIVLAVRLEALELLLREYLDVAQLCQPSSAHTPHGQAGRGTRRCAPWQSKSRAPSRGPRGACSSRAAAPGERGAARARRRSSWWSAGRRSACGRRSARRASCRARARAARS
jgi:hypothetical protein